MPEIIKINQTKKVTRAKKGPWKQDTTSTLARTTFAEKELGIGEFSKNTAPGAKWQGEVKATMGPNPTARPVTHKIAWTIEIWEGDKFLDEIQYSYGVQKTVDFTGVKISNIYSEDYDGRYDKDYIKTR
jgi:hypothetical protein